MAPLGSWEMAVQFLWFSHFSKRIFQLIIKGSVRNLEKENTFRPHCTARPIIRFIPFIINFPRSVHRTKIFFVPEGFLFHQLTRRPVHSPAIWKGITWSGCYFPPSSISRRRYMNISSFQENPLSLPSIRIRRYMENRYYHRTRCPLGIQRIQIPC